MKLEKAISDNFIFLNKKCKIKIKRNIIRKILFNYNNWPIL